MLLKYCKPKTIVESGILREDAHAAKIALEKQEVCDLDILSVSPSISEVWEDLTSDARHHYIVSIIHKSIVSKTINSTFLRFFLETMSPDSNTDIFWQTWEDVPLEIVNLTLEWIKFWRGEKILETFLNKGTVIAFEKAAIAMHGLQQGTIKRPIIYL